MEETRECGKALVFDIQGFSVHDGPGGRTLIFFKGCPLRCYWCCNPEGQEPYPELMHRRSRCQKCYRCVEACPYGAISVKEKGDFVSIDRTKCRSCTTFECVDHCYNGALQVAGKYFALEELVKKIERDRRFWGRAGGLTLGGGEVMQQYKFAARLLERCRSNYVHAAVETAGYGPWSHYEQVLPNVDWVFVDLKHMDSEMHRRGTGVPNGTILENVRRMAEGQGRYRLIIRIPIIPGYNDNEENMVATARFMREIGVGEVNILPFHRLGASKFEQLGRPCVYESTKSPSDTEMQALKRVFQMHGLTCYVGSHTPF